MVPKRATRSDTRRTGSVRCRVGLSVAQTINDWVLCIATSPGNDEVKLTEWQREEPRSGATAPTQWLTPPVRLSVGTTELHWANSMDTMLQRIALLLCLMLATTSWTAAAEKPNVLFIAVDDLNDWIGCMEGHSQALTPNMDRLAARGMLFTNAHCAAPACNPSRAAVFSGLMPNLTKVWSNTSGGIDKVYPKATYLPKTFSKAGYVTAGTGKLLHKRSQDQFQNYRSYEQRWSPFGKKAVTYTDEELPSKGSDNPRHVLKDSRGSEVVLPVNRMPSDRSPSDKKGESFDWGGFDLPDSDWGDTRITNWAIKQLKNKDPDKPLFLGVGYYRPHIPLFAPRRFFDRFKHERAQLPPYLRNDLDDVSMLGKKWAVEAVTAGLHSTVVKHSQWQAAVESYLACVTYVDHEIGRLFDALDASTMAKNTWIVLWSDHGWHLGEKDHWGKWTGWERSTKVPLIIVPPKKMSDQFAAAGAVCDHPVGLIDLFPTLVDVCGIKRPAKLHGDSLAGLLKDPKSSFRASTLTMFDRGNASLRSQKYRYLKYSDGSEELYDLQNDPNEWTNVIGKPRFAEIASDLRTQLTEHLSRTTSN